MLIGGVIFHADAYGDTTFRCNRHIISVGDYTSKVLEKCGEPDHRDEWEKIVETEVYEEVDSLDRSYYKPQIIKRSVKLERWTYNFGPQKFIRYLEFQEGELTKIETGDKGTLK